MKVFLYRKANSPNSAKISYNKRKRKNILQTTYLVINKMKNKLLLPLLIINIIFIYVSGMRKGTVTFLPVLLSILINISFSVYGFYKENNKIAVTALLLTLVTPALIFIVFINVFPFLTR